MRRLLLLAAMLIPAAALAQTQAPTKAPGQSLPGDWQALQNAMQHVGDGAAELLQAVTALKAENDKLKAENDKLKPENDKLKPDAGKAKEAP